MSNDTNLEPRLVEFAVRVMWLCGALPKSQAGQHIASELLRIGTTPAPTWATYRLATQNNRPIEANQALHTILIALHETDIWLKIIRKGKLLPDFALNDITTECEQLCHTVEERLKR